MNNNNNNNKAKEIKKPPILFDKTQEIIKKIEENTKDELLVYWSSENGAISDNDIIALYDILEKKGRSEKINIFIKSDGGDVEAALRITNLIREYFPYVRVFIPLQCASAATMIALGADEIHMGSLSYMTPIDSSLTHELSPLDRDNSQVSVNQDELLRIVKLWEKKSKEHHINPYSDIFKYIHPLVLGAIDRSSSLSTRVCKEILSYHLDSEEEAEYISKVFNYDYPSHSYPITAKEAAKIGLKIKKLDPNISTLFLQLNEIYSEMAGRALTDFDEYNQHDNEITSIVEGNNIQIYYQNDKDLHYIKDERRWQTLNENSSWRKIELVDNQKKYSTLHIR